MAQNFSELANFIQSVAEFLRGDYKPSDYGKVILLLTLLRRLDCVLEPTKDAVLKEYDERKDTGFDLPVPHEEERQEVLQHEHLHATDSPRRPEARPAKPGRLHRRVLGRCAGRVRTIQVCRPRRRRLTTRTFCSC